RAHLDKVRLLRPGSLSRRSSAPTRMHGGAMGIERLPGTTTGRGSCDRSRDKEDRADADTRAAAHRARPGDDAADLPGGALLGLKPVGLRDAHLSHAADSL